MKIYIFRLFIYFPLLVLKHNRRYKINTKNTRILVAVPPHNLTGRHLIYLSHADNYEIIVLSDLKTYKTLDDISSKKSTFEKNIFLHISNKLRPISHTNFGCMVQG